MRQIPRGQQGGYAYHVINRGNGRATVFRKPQDYEAFLSLVAEAKKCHRVKIFGFCLMPKHFHLVLEPAHQTALGQLLGSISQDEYRARVHAMVDEKVKDREITTARPAPRQTIERGKREKRSATGLERRRLTSLSQGLIVVQIMNA